jgi:hypothetical protein
MPNPIKYSTGSETDALKKGNFYIGTGSVGKGPSDVTGYYQGPSPVSGGYVIYMNKDGAPGNLSYHSATNDSELISFTNSLANTSFTSATQCLNYYATQTDKVCVNRDYEGIVTDGLVLNLDAGFTPSYPKSGTTWYNVGSSSNNGTLINGPTFSTDGGGSVVFDGVDDNTTFSSNTLGYNPGTTGELSLEIWVYPTGPYSNYNDGNVSQLGGLFGQGYFGGTTGFGIGVGNWIIGGTAFSFQVRNGGIVSEPGFTGGNKVFFQNNNWYHVVGTFTRNEFSRTYLNGVLSSSASSTNLNDISITPTNNARVSVINSFYSGCKMGIARLYNRPLTSSEVLQNYNAQKGRFGL